MFGVAVAVYATLRYTCDLSGFRAAGAMLRDVYHRFGDHVAPRRGAVVRMLSCVAKQVSRTIRNREASGTEQQLA
ncbi:hypothetical protein AB4305_22485 [Nocardia sp. 2YAB30]|uniref:hypothetical protein n=1 Tax=unclassified Nocardia TaxID=2637762 RepID=UPI003F9BF0C6